MTLNICPVLFKASFRPAVRREVKKWLLEYHRSSAVRPHCSINAGSGECNHANHPSITPFDRGINADGSAREEALRISQAEGKSQIAWDWSEELFFPYSASTFRLQSWVPFLPNHFAAPRLSKLKTSGVRERIFSYVLPLAALGFSPSATQSIIQFGRFS